MSRGNQRDTDRAKRQAKEAAKNKTNNREGTPAQRNMEDATKLQAKLAAKAAKKAEADNTPPAKAPVARKKGVAKKSENLDDLLNAGLSAGKKNRKK